jgi:hypothetical protein
VLHVIDFRVIRGISFADGEVHAIQNGVFLPSRKFSEIDVRRLFVPVSPIVVAIIPYRSRRYYVLRKSFVPPQDHWHAIYIRLHWKSIRSMRQIIHLKTRKRRAVGC